MHSFTSNSDSSPAADASKRTANWAVLRRFAVTITLVVAGFLAAGEIGMRLTGISYFSFGTPDLDLGWGNRPHAEGMFRKENPTEIRIRINSYGMNDAEHPVTKPAGVYRVAVLGNSYTEAFQVPNDQAYWHISEQEMNRCRPPDGRRVEVINFGVSGYGTAQALILLEKRVWAFQPDLVILAFLTGGDVWYNHRQLQRMDQAPYYVLRDGKLVLDDSFRAMIRTGRLRQLQFILERHSRTMQWATNSRLAFRQFVFDTLQRARGATAMTANKATIIKPTDLVYRAPDASETGKIWTEAWEVTEALIQEMNAACRREGVRFQLVTLTNPPQVHPDPAEREKLRQALGVTDLFYPDFRLRDFAVSHGIPIQNLAPEMAARAEREKTYLHGFYGGELGVGHWNATGNRWVGEAIGKRLCREIPLSSIP